jgi:hypothetical protein
MIKLMNFFQDDTSRGGNFGGFGVKNIGFALPSARGCHLFALLVESFRVSA